MWIARMIWVERSGCPPGMEGNGTARVERWGEGGECTGPACAAVWACLHYNSSAGSKYVLTPCSVGNEQSASTPNACRFGCIQRIDDLQSICLPARWATVPRAIQTVGRPLFQFRLPCSLYMTCHIHVAAVSKGWLSFRGGERSPT